MIWLALKWTMPSVNPKFTFFKLTFNDQTVLNLITPPNEKFNKCQKVISWLPWFGGSVCYQPWWLRFSESLSLKILALQIENTLNTIPGFIKKKILPTVWIHFQTDRWWVIRSIPVGGYCLINTKILRAKSYNKLLQTLRGNCISMLRVKVLRKPLYLNLYISFKVFKII